MSSYNQLQYQWAANGIVSAALPYRWKQTLQDVTVTIPVPSGTRSRDLIVEIKKTHLKVSLKGKEAIINDELCKEVRVDDSTWTLGEFNHSTILGYG